MVELLVDVEDVIVIDPPDRRALTEGLVDQVPWGAVVFEFVAVEIAPSDGYRWIQPGATRGVAQVSGNTQLASKHIWIVNEDFFQKRSVIQSAEDRLVS